MDKNIFSSFDLGWIVGILEADGCFTSTCTYVRKDGSSRRLPKVVVSMTDLDTVERFAQVLGFNRVTGPYQGRLSTKPTYSWAVTGQKAIDFMDVVKPYMSNRRFCRIEELQTDWRNSQ